MSIISDSVLYDAIMGAKLSFGEWLDDVLREKGMTQGDFAILIGTSQSTVNAWVNNVSKPTRRNGRAIADALDVDREEVRLRVEGRDPVTGEPVVAPGGPDMRDPLVSFSAMNQDRLSARQKRLLIQLAREWLRDDESGREA